MTSIKISCILESEKRELEFLLNIYLLELNEEPNYPYLNSYWEDEKRIPLKLIDGEIWLGFALINDYTIIPSNTISIAEFYILPEYRKQGLSRYFAKHIFNNYSGQWEIRQHIGSSIATSFWRMILINYTELKIGNEIIQYFSN